MGSTADFIGDIKILLNALISKPPPDNAIESWSLMVQKTQSNTREIPLWSVKMKSLPG